MAITVKIEGRGDAEFPDGTDPSIIERVVREQTASSSAPAARQAPDAADVPSFGGPAAKQGTRKDVLSIASPQERNTPLRQPTRKEFSQVARPVMEGGGAIAGSMLGSAAGPVGGVVGAGIGYATGSGLMDRFEHGSVDTNKIIPNALTGGTMEVGGLAVNKLVKGGAAAVKSMRTKGLPFSDKRNAYRAAEQFSAAQAPGTPVAAEANRLRQAETGDLANRLQPAVTPTPGQASGNYKSAALEQSMSAKDPAFAERLKYNDAELNKSAVNKLTSTLGKPADLPAVQPTSMTGEAQVKAINTAKAPVMSKEAEMWADVPAYPMPADGTEAAFKAAIATPSTAKGTIKSVYDIFKQTPRTVEGLQTIEREINSAMKAGTDTDRHFLRGVKQAVQDDFEAMGDAAASGDVALHGDKIVYPSKLRSELAGVEEQIAAAQTAAPSLKEQNKHIYKYLNSKGEQMIPMQGVNTSDGQWNAALTGRLERLQTAGKAADYAPVGEEQLWVHQLFGKDAPYDDALEAATTGKWDRGWFNKDKPWNGNPNTPIITSKTTPNDVSMNLLEKSHRGGLPADSFVYENAAALGEGRGLPLSQLKGKTAAEARELLKKAPVVKTEPTNPVTAGLEARRTALTDQLANLKPAEDVAAKYSAAKRYSKEEKFDRFYRGAVKDVLQSGEQASGQRVPAEQVPAKFFTPTGSKDLIKAVGKEQAAEQSMPHAVEQLVSKTVDANTGVMNVPRAVAWMRQNAATLDNLGLTKSVEQVVKGQIPRAIEAELETKAVDVLGNPSATVLQAAKMIKKFGPSVEKMYGPKGMQALQDWGQMMEVIGRNKYVSYAKGSTTVEKSAASADMAEKVSTLAAVATGHGWVFSATKNIAKSLMGPALNYSKAQVNMILQEALINPEAAAVLMKIAKAQPEQVASQSAKWLKPIILQLQVSGKLAADQPRQTDTPPTEEQ